VIILFHFKKKFKVIPLSTKLKKLFLFDIDKCILPSIFPKLLKDEQSKEEQQDIINIIHKKAKKIKLYPNYIEFYKNYCERENVDVWFLTGRKSSQLKELTLKQLKPISIDPFITFFPENGEYTQEFYTNWKLKSIISFLNEHTYDRCYVFDDDTSYFYQLLTEKYHTCETYEINCNEDWYRLNVMW